MSPTLAARRSLAMLVGAALTVIGRDRDVDDEPRRAGARRHRGRRRRVSRCSSVCRCCTRSGAATLGLQIAALTLVIVGAVALGAFVAARAMFISGHDLAVIEVVLVAAAHRRCGRGGCGSVVAVAATSSSLVDATRRIGGPAEASRPRRCRARRSSCGSPASSSSMEQRLDEARRRERAVEDSRRELVAWVSHDLRTPLAAIRAMVEALEDGVVTDPETVARYHSTLRTETDRLAALVDDLFELSRTQSGALGSNSNGSRSTIWSRTRSRASRRSRRRRACASRVGSTVPHPRSRSPRRRCCALCATCSRTRSGTRRPTARSWSRRAARTTDGLRLGASTRAAGSRRPTSNGSSMSATRWTGPARPGSAGLGLAIARGFVEAHHGVITRRQRERRRPVHRAHPDAGRVIGRVRVLVTGGAGFIGTHVVAALRADGDEVRRARPRAGRRRRLRASR